MEYNKFNIIFSDFYKNVLEKKESVIKEKIKEKTGIDLDTKEEMERRFPRFSIVSERTFPSKETVYFNDGSIKGLRIVTFEEEITSDILIEEYKTTLSYKYY